MRIQPKHAKRNQQGMASIVVVMMLVIVLSLVSLGLARLVDRATQRATANNAASAANLAAKAGINDTISLLKAVPTTQANACGDLLADKQPFGNGRAEFGSPDTKYTCILINKTPEELNYQAVPAYKSKIITISPSTALGKFMFSWQAIDRNLRQPSLAASQPLYDETTWAQKQMPPLLRLSIYQLPNDSKLNNVDANARTYFLYPNKGSGAVTRINYATQATGSLIQSGCGATGTGDFTGSADDDCNVIIDNLTTDQNYQYVIRMTPYYGTADLKIKANDKDNKVYTFNNTQFIVDVTAKSGAAVKRLRAFVEAPNAPNATNLISPNDDAFPEFGLQSSFAICKRLISDDVLKTTTLETNSSAYCSLPLAISPPTPPPAPTPPPPVPKTNWIAPGSVSNNNFSQTDNDTDPCPSSSDGRYTAYAWHAADGNQGPCYNAQSSRVASGQWWQVDLGQVRHVDRVVIYYRDASYQFPFSILGGANSCGSWVTLKTVSTVSSAPVSVSGLNADIRCLRINVNSRVSFGEVEIWNQ